MKKLGIDIGTNSIGWALVDEDRIIDLGARIFPVGVKEDDYNKSGSEVSKNVTRRDARSARRLNFRFKLRRERLQKLLFENEMLPDLTDEKMTPMELFELRKRALYERLELKEIGRIFLMLNARRGFKSNRKDKSQEADKEKSVLKQEMNELEAEIEKKGHQTLGEYFYSLFLKAEKEGKWNYENDPIEPIRKRFVWRHLYEREFDLIWEKQKEYYPEILTEENKVKFKDQTIFYQRDLKSQKFLKGKCTFEPTKRCAPKASPLYQKFRLYQFINNLRVTDEYRAMEMLSKDERIGLFEYLNKKENIKLTAINKVLKLKKTAFFNDMPQNIKGNTTNARLIKIFGEDFINELSEDEYHKLWHTLLFAEDEKWLYDYAKKEFEIDDDKAKKYVNLTLEDGYANLSTKAIKRINPYLEEGYEYSEACKKAGYNHSEVSPNQLQSKIDSENINLRNPLVQQSVNETIRLVNAVIDEYGNPDEIRVEMARKLKMPKDKRENIKRRNDEKEKRRERYREFLKSKLGFENISKSLLLKFELWLELEFAETELKKISSHIDPVDFEKFCKKVKPTDKEKYDLWLECGRISPFTGKVISLSKLFSSDIEIEHIIPYSVSMDDSFSNKTLCEEHFNKYEKGNRIPYEYFKNRDGQWEEFKKRAKKLPKNKAEKLLATEIDTDFKNSQLTNTTYIAKEVIKELRKISTNVRITNGQATSQLRKTWGFSKILNPDGKNEKSRDDHRHHIIDAVTIAFTNNNYINLLSRNSSLNERGRLRSINIPEPFTGVQEELRDKLNQVFISYKKNNRLISTKKNKYIHSKSPKHDKTFEGKRSISARGPLHKESYYGRIFNSHENEENFVIRKSLTALTEAEIPRIIDPKVREIITGVVEKDGLKALADDIYMFSYDEGKKILIKKVRIKPKIEKLIKLRNTDNSPYVATDNHAIKIITDNKGKRQFRTISFFEAVKNKLNDDIEYDSADYKEILTLHKMDMVIVYENSPDEIDWEDKSDLFNRLFIVRKFVKDGRISLVKHNYSNVNPDKAKDYPEGIVKNTNYNGIKAVKINISNTGKIERV